MEALSQIEALQSALSGQATSEEVAALLEEALQETWEERVERALEEAADALRQDADLSPSEVSGILRARLSDAYAAQVRAIVEEAIEIGYGIGQEGVTPGSAFRFNMADRRAIEWLKEHNMYWIGTHYSRQVRGRIQSLGEETLKEGLSRFASAERFAESELGKELGKSHSYWELMSNHVTTRSREFGRVEQYVKAGVERVMVDATIDRRTSCVCETLDGTIYPVEALVSHRDALMGAGEPETVKRLSPWVDCDRIEALVSSGPEALIQAGVVLPPYHANCRTRTVIA